MVMFEAVCSVSETEVDQQVPRCRDGDDDEDCDGGGSSGATGEFLLLHNDASIDHPAATSIVPPSSPPSNHTDGHKPPSPTADPHVSPVPRGVASKRSGTDSDDARGSAAADGGGDSSPVPAASSNSRLAVHVGLIAGSSVGVVVVLLIAALAVYKYRSRDQGSYRLDPDAPNGYVAAPGCERFRLRRTSSSGLSSSGPADQNGSGAGGTIYRLRSSRSRSKGRRDVKEWYV